MPPYDMRVEMVDGEARVVLVGDIDLVAVPELFERMHDADRLGGHRIILDLEAATLLDSAALGVIGRLAGAGVRIEIRGATGVVGRALRISGVDQTANVTVT